MAGQLTFYIAFYSVYIEVNKLFQKVFYVIIALSVVSGSTLAQEYSGGGMFKGVLADQNIGFEQLGIDDGLVSDKIYDVKQDRRGFIWMASYNGLDRYDGSRIVHYLQEPGDSTTLPSSLIKKIEVGPEGDLWVVTNSGEVAWYNRTYENFRTYEIENDHGDLTVFNDIFTDTGNNLWMASLNNGLMVLEANTAETRKVNVPEIEGKQVYSVYVFGDSVLLDTGDPSSFLLYNKQSGKTDRVLLSDKPGEKSYRFFSKTFYRGNDGVLWVGTEVRGLYRLEGDQVKWYSSDNGTLSGNTVTSIIEFDEQTLWVSLDDGGISVINKNGELIKFLKAEHEDPFSLSVNNVERLFKDRQGIIWAGTYGGGINKYDPGKFVFKKVTTYPHNPKTISNENVLSFYQDTEGDIWIGTDGGGINKLIRHRYYDHYQHDPNDPFSLSGNAVICLQEDNTGRLWAGTFGRGISIMDKATGRFVRHMAGEKTGLRNNTVWDILKDSKGAIWIGQVNGDVARYDQKTEQYVYVKNNAPNKDALYVRSMYEDPAGNLWCSFLNNGLWLIDRESMKMEKVDAGILNNFTINHMLTDRDGRTWLATERFGMVELIEKEGKYSTKFVPLTDDGAGVKFARAIVEDHLGRLWVSTEKGIFMYDKVSGLVDHFTINNGLQSNQFSFGACLYTRDSTIFFGGIKGYTYFKPSDIVAGTSNYNVEITGLKIMNEELVALPDGIMGQSLLETKEIILNHKQNTLDFEFSELEFSGNIKTYCYMLEGFDKNWFTGTSVSSVRYTNLAPGKYTFLVRSAISNQCVEGQPASLSINIMPPWYENQWVRFLMFLLVVAIIYLVFRIRILISERRNQELENVVEERTENLRRTNIKLNETNRKLTQAQNELFAQEKMASLGNLMAGIAHEINNPLNYITAGMGVMDEERKELEEALGNEADVSSDCSDTKKEMRLSLKAMSKVSKNINNGINKILEIINGLKVYTRAGLDEMEYVDIHQNIDATLKVHEYSHKYLMEIIREYDQLPEIQCHPGKVNQVFSNLIGNACHAIEERYGQHKNGLLVIITHYDQPNDQVVLKFADNGPGVPESIKGSVFDPFVTGKPQGKGTGLGLSLSNSIDFRSDLPDYSSLTNQMSPIYPEIFGLTSDTVAYKPEIIDYDYPDDLDYEDFSISS